MPRQSKRGRNRKPRAGVGDQGECLEGESECGPDPEQSDLGVGDVRDLFGGGHQAEVKAEHGDQDEVVEDRGPHHRAEPVPGIEDLTENAEHAVEEDLREQEAGEGHGQLERVVRGGCVALVDADDLRSRPRGQRGPRGEDAQHQGDQALFEGGAAVKVFCAGPYELGDQDRVQCAADQQEVQTGRHRVGLVVGGGQQPGAQRGALQHLAYQTGGTRDHRSHRHQRRRTQ